MKERTRGETVLALLFVAVFVVLILTSLSYSRKARRMPLVVMIPGVVLASVEVARGTIRRRRIPDVQRSDGPQVQKKRGSGVPVQDWKKVIEMIGWVLLMVAMIFLFGFLLTIPVYTLLFMKARKESWRSSLLFAAIGFAALYFLFVLGLHIELYPGVFKLL